MRGNVGIDELRGGLRGWLVPCFPRVRSGEIGIDIKLVRDSAGLDSHRQTMLAYTCKSRNVGVHGHVF
jgi:hypothetical protein